MSSWRRVQFRIAADVLVIAESWPQCVCFLFFCTIADLCLLPGRRS